MRRTIATQGAAKASLFLVSLLVLLRTMVPTVYSYDSGEFAIGAYQLGIVHAPGYPLYLIIAHLFTGLPLGDVAFRVNLLSAVALAGTVPVLFTVLYASVKEPWVAASVSLCFVWGYYSWYCGLHAEIYAAQAFSVALLLWALLRFYNHPTPARGVTVGTILGLAVAIAPMNILLSPGVAIAFIAVRCDVRLCLASAIVSLACFGVWLLYFPLVYAAHPTLNLAGQYDQFGAFVPVDLRTIGGIWWMLTGRQFAGLFSWLPPAGNFGPTLAWFFQNFLGVGVLLGIIGVLTMKDRGRLLVWACLFIPITYFVTAYKAVDRDTMFVPSYLLWAVMIAYGLAWVLRQMLPRVKVAACIALPVLFLVVNFPLVDSHDDTSIRDYAEKTLKLIPQNAVVLGNWFEVVPLQYMQMVEGQRQDLDIKNLFLFDTAPGTLDNYLTMLTAGKRPVFAVGSELPVNPPVQVVAQPVRGVLPAFDHSGDAERIVGYDLITSASSAATVK
jgi:hypothetical protein